MGLALVTPCLQEKLVIFLFVPIIAVTAMAFVGGSYTNATVIRSIKVFSQSFICENVKLPWSQKDVCEADKWPPPVSKEWASRVTGTRLRFYGA